jgi:hypothetical protein
MYNKATDTNPACVEFSKRPKGLEDICFRCVSKENKENKENKVVEG